MPNSKFQLLLNPTMQVSAYVSGTTVKLVQSNKQNDKTFDHIARFAKQHARRLEQSTRRKAPELTVTAGLPLHISW
jgi:hypothetical protein